MAEITKEELEQMHRDALLMWNGVALEESPTELYAWTWHEEDHVGCHTKVLCGAGETFCVVPSSEGYECGQELGDVIVRAGQHLQRLLREREQQLSGNPGRLEQPPPAAQPQPSAWRSEPPAEPGWWGKRDAMFPQSATMVELFSGPEGLLFRTHIGNGEFMDVPVSACRPPIEWCGPFRFPESGPLAPPPAPGKEGE